MVSIVSTNIKKKTSNANIFLCKQFSLLNYFWTKDYLMFSLSLISLRFIFWRNFLLCISDWKIYSEVKSQWDYSTTSCLCMDTM